MLLAIGVEGKSLTAMTTAWGKGFWSLLAFTTQMAVILAMGYVLATAPLTDRLLDRIVSHVHQPRTAIIVATLVGGIGSYLNWGFGLVIGGVVAKKLALKVKGVHYPLIIAAAYSGFTMYGLGLSASIPVLVATPGHPTAGQMGVIPLTQTIFSVPMLITSLVIIVTLPLLNAWLHPKLGDKVVEVDPAIDRDATAGGADDMLEKNTIATRLNNSRILSLLIGLMGVGYVVLHFTGGGSLDLNLINFIILFLGIILLGTPAAYVAKLTEGIKTISGIILQYPFYAGIMAIMAALGPGDDHFEDLRRRGHARDAALLGPDQLLRHQLLRAFRRRPLGDPGSVHDRRRQGNRQRAEPDHHGRDAGQRLERPGAALLDPAGAGVVQAQIARRDGLHGDHDAVGGRDSHRRRPLWGYATH